MKNPFIKLAVFLAFLFALSSCVNNTTLHEFDLGQNRSIKITTGWIDNYVPIYYETYVNGEQTHNRFYLFSESPEYETIKKLRFNVIGDKSDQIFAVMQEAPDTGSLAFVDFSTGFRYPGCSNNHGAECINRRNQLAEILERDNPGLKLNRLEVPAYECSCSCEK